LLHRLDRPVSGIVLFAKTSKGASRLSAQFRHQTVKKIYHCLVRGRPKQVKGVLRNYLKKDEKRNKVIIYKNKQKGSEIAELYYEVIDTNDNYSLLRVELKTGKPHQIRSQLAYLGCPIVGDLKYGAPFALADKSIALSATQLSFQTATGEKRIELSVPAPLIWEKYIKK